jgi:uncharacterized protein (TIGR02231 family)
MTTKIELPIDEVTLLEDRARVVRRGTIALGAGTHRVRIDDVSPIIADKTLAARGARVHDVRVERRARVLAADRDAQVREIEETIEATNETLVAIARRIARIDSALALLAQAGQRTIEEISTDAAWSKPDDGWEARIERVAENERALWSERLSLFRKDAEVRREQARLTQRKAALSTPSTDLSAAIVIDLEIDGATELTVEYVVPSACWRPYHRAEREGSTLTFESDGCVWQNTGEDWREVSLRFSTQRPSLGVEPPRLASDELRIKRKSDAVYVEQRADVIERTGVKGAASPDLPGIDDAGEAIEIAAPHRATIPSDGRPHRVALGSFETELTASSFAVPELVSAVLERSVQVHEGARPILAGPVDLVREGGLIGKTSILYVACGESFELGWGPDPTLRVSREVEELSPETNLLRNWHSVTRKIVDKISNLGNMKKRIELVERVPVSEIEKVKIELDREHTTNNAAPDGDGFVRFVVELSPFGRSAIEVRYTLRRHSDVVGL